MWMASCATEGSGWGVAESSKTDSLVIWRISLDPYGALSGTEAVRSPRVIDPADELNCAGLLIGDDGRAGGGHVEERHGAGDRRGETAQRQERGVVEQGEVDPAHVLAGAERDRQARGARGGNVDRLAVAAGEVRDADHDRVAGQGIDGEGRREVVARGAVAVAVEQGAGRAHEGVRPAVQGDRVGVGREQAGGA